MRETRKKTSTRKSGDYLIDGVSYPSVTTVLSTVLAKPMLIPWANKLGAIWADQNPEASIERCYAESVIATRDAASARGSEVHRIAEGILKGIVVPEKVEALYQPYVKALVAFYNDCKPVRVRTEYEVLNKTLGYAGRCDAVVDMGGVQYLLDFKTSREIYRETGLQLSAYKNAELVVIRDGEHKKTGEEKPPKVDKLAVVHLKKDATYSLVEMPERLDIFQSVLEIYKWMKEA